MARPEDFTDQDAATLASTDYLWLSRGGAAAGSRDRRFAFPAWLRTMFGLTFAADKLPYVSATNTIAMTALTAAGRAILDDADAAAQRATLSVKQILTATATLDFGSISAAASADLTIPVTGAAVGDAVAIGLPAAPAAGIVFMGFVSAADTVTVRAMNITGSGVDPASATYRATVFKAT